MIFQSTITCPNCGAEKTETMRADACQVSYQCTGCGAKLRPRPAVVACFVPTARHLSADLGGA